MLALDAAFVTIGSGVVGTNAWAPLALHKLWIKRRSFELDRDHCHAETAAPQFFDAPRKCAASTAPCIRSTFELLCCMPLDAELLIAGGRPAGPPD